MLNNKNYGSGVSEIEEELDEKNVVENNEESEEYCIYVAVGKSDTSMEALSWTLNNLITTHTTILYLIHVFPEIKHIPHPCNFFLITSLSSI